MKNRQPTEESFLKDVENHKMTVLMDNGIYRHLRFSSGSFNMQFDIVTYPWNLVYSGDMGCYVFNRLDDMFQFFRSRPRDEEKMYINTGYWGEKLEAVDRRGDGSDFRIFSPQKMKDQIEEVLAEWVKDFEDANFYECDAEEIAAGIKEFESALREAVEEDIYRWLDEGEHYARKALNDFEFTPEPKHSDLKHHTYRFSGTWEWNCREYTYRYVWCCYAIAYAVQQYDTLMGEGVNNETSIASAS